MLKRFHQVNYSFGHSRMNAIGQIGTDSGIFFSSSLQTIITVCKSQAFLLQTSKSSNKEGCLEFVLPLKTQFLNKILKNFWTIKFNLPVLHTYQSRNKSNIIKCLFTCQCCSQSVNCGKHNILFYLGLCTVPFVRIPEHVCPGTNFQNS